MKLISATILTAVLVLTGVFAVAGQYRFDSWTTDNGLPQNGVRAITQTPDGYLWLTTLDGLVRFDGVKFTVFNRSNSKGIISNRFWAAGAFDDGSVWAATEGGDLTIYREGEFTSYPADQIPGTQIIGFGKDENGEILINVDPNFYYLRNGEFVLAKPTGNDGTAKNIQYGRTGTRWEVYQTETRQIRDGQTNTYRLNVKFALFHINNVYEDTQGGLWIADLGKLFYLRDGEITDYTEKAGFLDNVLGHSFWEEADGSVWFATGDFNRPGIGLVRFKDGKFIKFGAEYGLSNNRILHRFKDREGTIWLATDRGLNRLRPQVVTPLSTKEGLIHNEVYPILKTRDGSIYIGTNGGLSRYQDGKFTNISFSAGKEYGVSSLQALAEDAEGRLWIGVVGGLFTLKDGKLEDKTKILKTPDTIYAIYAQKDGSVWFATEHQGIYQYRNGQVVTHYTTAEGLSGNDVKVIHEARDGTLWFGTFSGLSHLKDGNFTNYTIGEGLASNFVRSIKEDEDGTFWIGTYDGGLSRLKDDKFFNFNTKNGLFNNGVFATVEDGKGNFWISSNKGIFRVNKQQLNDFADGKIASYDSVGYGKQDGMLNTECNGGRQPSAITEDDGSIWFPTLEGIAIVNPDSRTTNRLPPPVQIESVEIDRKNADSREMIFVNPEQTYVDISYTALSFIKSDQIRFKHKLEGVDKDWVDAGTRRTVNYSFLPAGEYTFTVIAANSDGVWNNVGRSIAVKVAAPFYRTWWFFLLAIALSIAVGLLIYRYRIGELNRRNLAQETFSRQLIESQETERKRIVQEIHDGLGQSLLIIKNRAAMGRAATQRDKADEQLDEITDSVTNAIAEVRVIAQNLRPLHLERLGLTATLEEMVEQIDESSEIEINYDIENIDGLLTATGEMNLYRVIQESLNNVIKHSGATKASVNVHVQNGRMAVTIRDNGTGFDRETNGTNHGLGLNGIAERTKILDGILSINAEIGKGTLILIDVPAVESS